MSVPARPGAEASGVGRREFRRIPGDGSTGAASTGAAWPPAAAWTARRWPLLALFAIAVSGAPAADGAAPRPAGPSAIAVATTAATTGTPAGAASTERLLELGRSLFEQGLGRDGREIGARMGAGEGLGLRGGAVACANCHGRDGRGGGEGWIRAPDLRWFALGRPNTRANGAARPAYDERSLTRALRGGTGADAIALDATMPRYDLADDEIAALSAYLRALDDRHGAASPRPSLLVLLPEGEGGPAARLLDGWRNCPLPAAGRGQEPPGHKRPALSVLRYARLGDALSEVARRDRAGTVAALFAPYLIGAEPAFDRAALSADLPVLLPISLRGLDPDPAREPRLAPVLFALPSQRLQALALVRDAAGAPAWSVYRAPEDRAARDQARALVDELAGQGIAAREIDRFDPSVAGPVLLLSPLPPPRLERVPEFVPGRDSGAAASAPDLRLPAANMQLAAAQAWRERGARIRMAFAYPPRPAAAPARWIGPEQAWTALGCELLARLPPTPADASGLPRWRAEVAALGALDLGGWFQLPARADRETTLSRIELRDWPDSAAVTAAEPSPLRAAPAR